MFKKIKKEGYKDIGIFLMFILNKLMLLKLNNIVPQKCSVHKIITGFIKNINS